VEQTAANTPGDITRLETDEDATTVGERVTNHDTRKCIVHFVQEGGEDSSHYICTGNLR
jgi:hypothetical protein